MNESIRKIYDIIKDYRSDEGIQITPEDIRDWAFQFGDEAEFMVQELSHLLPQVYFSKERVIKEMRDVLNNLIKLFQYTTVESFLRDVCFLNLQKDGKSQGVLIQIIDEIIMSKGYASLSHYSAHPKKIFVYVDDVLASGGTIGSDLIRWLGAEKHAEDVANQKISLVVALLCAHTWGHSFVKYRISQNFPEASKRIKWGWAYEIQNHLKWADQSLNIAIPIKDQPEDVRNYLSTLQAQKYEEYAMREINNPHRETFFTSPESRIRYENNLLRKGLEIIARVNNPSDTLRPLGLVNKNYKTYGLGTHFFTWRNVPNNSPLVFWWDVPAHGWKPLFKPKKNY